MRNIAFFSLDYKEMASAGLKSGFGGLVTGGALTSTIPAKEIEKDPYLPLKTALSSAAVGTGLGLYNNYLSQKQRQLEEEKRRKEAAATRKSNLIALGTGAGLSAAAMLALRQR